MLSDIQKKIIIRAMRIRKEFGDEPENVLSNYKNLSEDEIKEILSEVQQ